MTEKPTTTKPDEFTKYCALLPSALEPWFIPLKRGSKEPDVPKSESTKDPKHRLTKEQAYQRLVDGLNVGIMATGKDLVFFDLDDPEKYTFHRDTLDVKTANGKLHKHFLNDGRVRNADGKGRYKGCGEVRAEWKYVVAPGSFVVPDSHSGDGVYRVVVERQPVLLGASELPPEFQPTPAGDMAGGAITRSDIGPPYANHNGEKLANFRKSDAKLDKLLRNFNHDYLSPSEADMACLGKLLYYEYTRPEAAAILIAFRDREKLKRQDYIDMTLAKIKDGLTYTSYTEPEEAALDTKQKRKQFKDSGLCEGGCFEAIYSDSHPAFLVRNGVVFRIVDNIDVGEDTFYPKDDRQTPYRAYEYFKGECPNREDLFWKVRNLIDMYVDVESIWKDLLAACVLLSYQQEKLQTTPYVFLYGDNESGKSTVLTVMQHLCYRPMYGVTIPPADLYGYLEDSDSIPTILEDEIQGIDYDTDKIKIYKAGYKQGAVVPRILSTPFERIIKYYQTFCLKLCAGEQMSKVKGFWERFIPIGMVEGYPQKEWADVTKEDLEQFYILRNMLLKWRMASREWTLPQVELTVKGRTKELWKPILQVTSGLTVFDTLKGHVMGQQQARMDAKQNTLEGHIVKVVVETLNMDVFKKRRARDVPVAFKLLWEALQRDLEGKIDNNKPHVMDTSEFDLLTKNKVGYRLREVLSGQSKSQRDKGPDGKATGAVYKAYTFDPEKLKRIAKKYGYKLCD